MLIFIGCKVTGFEHDQLLSRGRGLLQFGPDLFLRKKVASYAPWINSIGKLVRSRITAWDPLFNWHWIFGVQVQVILLDGLIDVYDLILDWLGNQDHILQQFAELDSLWAKCRIGLRGSLRRVLRSRIRHFFSFHFVLLIHFYIVVGRSQMRQFLINEGQQVLAYCLP